MLRELRPSWLLSSGSVSRLPPTFMIVGVAVASPMLDSHLLSQTAGHVLEGWADRGQRGAFHGGHTCVWDRAAEKQLEVTVT